MTIIPAVPIPDLRIVPTDDIVPHEPVDNARVQKLVETLLQDNILKNPVIVTPLRLEDEHEQFLLLDGTNRHSGLRTLNIQHTLVQVVQYDTPQVRISAWNHVLTHTSRSQIEVSLQTLPGTSTSLIDRRDAQSLLEHNEILAYCILDDDTTLAFDSPHNLMGRIKTLRDIVDTYIQSGPIHRTALSDPQDIQAIYPDLVAVMVFPVLTHHDILEIASLNEKVPSGITRHIIQGRALRLNYDLAKLRSAHAVNLKNSELRSWIENQFSARSARLYEEATYLFDE